MRVIAALGFVCVAWAASSPASSPAASPASTSPAATSPAASPVASSPVASPAASPAAESPSASPAAESPSASSPTPINIDMAAMSACAAVCPWLTLQLPNIMPMFTPVANQAQADTQIKTMCGTCTEGLTCGPVCCAVAMPQCALFVPLFVAHIGPLCAKMGVNVVAAVTDLTQRAAAKTKTHPLFIAGKCAAGGPGWKAPKTTAVGSPSSSPAASPACAGNATTCASCAVGPAAALVATAALLAVRH